MRMRPFPGFTPYCAAKGGLRMLMRNAALELAPYKIRVNNIAPRAIATPINAQTLQDPQNSRNSPGSSRWAGWDCPRRWHRSPHFLASDRASYVTGATYYVDGGFVRFAESL